MSSTEPQSVVEDAQEDPEDNYELLSLVKKFISLFGYFFFGYLVAYFGFSLWLISIASFLLVIREKQQFFRQKRIKLHRDVRIDEKALIKYALKDLPAWVHFPDMEKAEWLNKILKQMWPFLVEFMTNLLKTQIAQNIDDIMPDYCKGFRFEKIELGNVVS